MSWELRFRHLGFCIISLILGSLVLAEFALSCFVFIDGGVVGGLFGLAATAFCGLLVGFMLSSEWEELQRWADIDPPPGFEFTADGRMFRMPLYRDSTGSMLLVGSSKRWRR